MTFAEKLQAHRKREGISQEELAERLGVSRQSVSKWELGQAYPETAKLIELSRMMGVTVDELLKEEGSDAGQTGPEIPEKKRRRPGCLAAVMACGVVAIFILVPGLMLLNLTSPGGSDPAPAELGGICSGESEITRPETPPAAPQMEDLQRYYFNFAQVYRLDYIPFFEAGEAPTDATEYLYFAFAANLDNWGEDKGTMTKEYVEETVKAYFGVTGLTHRSAWKNWDYDGAVYTAWPEGIKLPPECRLVRYETHARDGVQYHDVTLDFLLVEGEEAEAMAEAGNLEGLPALSRERFVYTESRLNFGRPYFISHQTAEF